MIAINKGIRNEDYDKNGEYWSIDIADNYYFIVHHFKRALWIIFELFYYNTKQRCELLCEWIIKRLK